jgi:hypothetical protein
MSETDVLDRGEQATLLDINTKDLNPYWVDEKQPLKVPVNPLHYEAHKYQILLNRLDIQAAKNPAQFNSGNYIQVMDKLSRIWDAINRGETLSEVLDKSRVGQDRQPSAAAGVGETATPGLGLGVSADNPITG